MSEYILSTFTGIQFDLLNPTIDMICIEDIAHHLALENRFNGGTRFPISVGYHSINMCKIASEEFKLEYLLHDVEETYYKDFPTPLKALLKGGEYELLTSMFMDIADKKFKFNRACGKQMVIDDKRMGVTEILQLCNNFPEANWMQNYRNLEPYPIQLFERNWKNVELEFLDLYNKYKRI